MVEKISLREPRMDRKRESIERWNVPGSVKREVLRFLDDLALGKVNKGVKLADNTLAKYVVVLKVALEYLDAPTEQIKLQNLETFDRALTSGELKSTWERPYSHSMCSDIRVALRIFLRWRIGPKADKLTDWFDCRDKPKTPEYLKESEIEKLYKAARSAEERYLIAVLFDSGARAEEFHNIRFEDVELPEGNRSFVKLTLKDEYSKTEGRTISLYWKHSLDAVREFLQQRIHEGIRSDEPLFTWTYDRARFVLSRLGKRVLGKHVHFHLFRHSSATFFASQMNRQELCIRYGWKFSSNMPDVYISRAGVDSKQLDERFTQSQLGELKDQLVKKDREEKFNYEKILQLEQQLTVMQTKYQEIAEVLSLKPTIHELEQALSRKLRLRAN